MESPYLSCLPLLFVVAAPAAATVQADDPFPSASPESQGMSSEALAALAEEVTESLERDYAVGAELLVIKNHRTVLHEAFGHSDRVEGTPWSKGTICNIRSMTKPITGAAVQLLVDRGELALDDPAARYLPGFDTDEARDITVRQILTHRAGLPMTILTSMEEYESLIDMDNAVGARGPEFEPGSPSGTATPAPTPSARSSRLPREGRSRTSCGRSSSFRSG